MSVAITPLSAARTAIDGLWVYGTRTISDGRGAVREFFRASSYAVPDPAGPLEWKQVNLTWTRRGALRGLHGESMTKLVGVAHGEAFGVYLDARPRSATHGTVVTVSLVVGVQVLVPPGVCNGFQAVSDPGCQYLYCFDREWEADMPGVGVNPLDPDLGIDWPIRPDRSDPASISAKDAGAPFFGTL